MEIHEVVGGFGPWQKRVFVVTLYLYLVGIWQNLSINFLAPNVPYRCVEPSSFSESTTDNGTATNYFDNSCTAPSNSSSDSIVPCSRWEYDTTQYSDTIVSEWNLVCDREWLVSLVKSVYMVGFLVSVIVFGQMADWIGRFRVIVLGFILASTAALLTLLSTSYTSFAILRFVLALGRAGLINVVYVLMLEIIGFQYRAEAGVGMQVAWSLGTCTLPLFAYFIRSWMWLHLAISIPFLITAFFLKIFPESPRWLKTQGKFDELEKLLIKAAKVNHREIKGNVRDLEIFKGNQENENKRKKTLFDILRSPSLRCRTFCLVYLWMVNSFLYYGMIFNTNDWAGDPYLNFFLTGLLEFPSYALLYWVIRRFGRRYTLLAYTIAEGCTYAGVALTSLLASGNEWVEISLMQFGKFCITGSFGLLYIYTSELYPTVVRSTGMGTCSMVGRIGSILGPFVRELGRASHPSVPNILFCALTLSSGITAFIFLPETSSCKLTDTLEEQENFEESGQKTDFHMKDISTSESNSKNP